VAAIAIDLQVVARHASGNQGFELFSGHKFVCLQSLVSALPFTVKEHQERIL
jgi:hypothetical protein